MRQSEIRTVSHDLKNYMTGLWGFTQENKWDEATRCIENVISKLSDADSGFDTGHPALDAILRLKKQSIDLLDIRFDVLLALPKEISVDVLDLCVIVGNGLDNAIEACEKLADGQERYIRLKVNSQSRYISICIENPADHVDMTDKLPKTTKSDKFYHGLGLESIRALTEKYDGSLDIIAANKVFKLAAMVKNV